MYSIYAKYPIFVNLIFEAFSLQKSISDAKF